MKQTIEGWSLDPADPRAPPQDVWDRLSDEERALVVASLPPDSPVDESATPEGEPHNDASTVARDSLRGHYERHGRALYIATDLTVYYPGERRFAPDVLAVLDVELHPRESWVVSAEGKGLDLALEVLAHGDRRKDFERNVAWFPHIGISEYFVFDLRRGRLHAWRLPSPDATRYERVVPQGGYFHSDVLGLDLGLVKGELRFFDGGALVPAPKELMERLDAMVADLAVRLEEETRRADEGAQRAEEEAQRAEDAERRARELEAEVARLKGEE